MMSVLYILISILELILTSFIVVKIIKLEKKILPLNQKLFIFGKKSIENIKKFRLTIQKVNKIVSIITNEKFWRIKRIIFAFIDIIQIYLLIKSLKHKAKYINFKIVKKVLCFQAVKNIVKKILTLFNMCTCN